jgi:chromosome segregation and condensation protein ScpB
MNKKQNKARLGNPYQLVVSSEFYRNFNLNHRFDARPRW